MQVCFRNAGGSIRNHMMIRIFLLLCLKSFIMGNDRLAGRTNMDLVRLRDSSQCLDGSEAGFYFRAGIEDGVAHWIIYLDGSGWCFSEDECLARVNTTGGSSMEWPDQMSDVGGILGSDPVHNPDFAHWTHVYAPSCDGSSFSSNRSSPLKVHGQALHFSGASTVEALISNLAINISSAKRVLVAGSGSGGLAVLLHIDSIALALRSLPGFKGDVVGLADSAFIPHTVAGSPSHAVPRFISAHSLWQPVRPLGGCEEGPDWMCLFSSMFAAKIQTPIHVIQSTHDCAHIKMCMQEWQGMGASVAARYEQLRRINQQASLVPSAPQSPSLVFSGGLSSSWEQAVRASLDGIRKHNSHGLYILSCPAHSQLVTRCSPVESDDLSHAPTQLSNPSQSAAVMPAGAGGAVSTGEGLEWTSCSMCGGWNKHYVKVGCQMISLREGFGDWYFSWPWKGGYAEYTKVIDNVQGAANKWCTRGSA